MEVFFNQNDIPYIADIGEEGDDVTTISIRQSVFKEKIGRAV
ncbi:hypothetical protein [Gudongella oleilytica]|nr:hypothetical protein [Gudongella oleilytica]